MDDRRSNEISNIKEIQTALHFLFNQGDTFEIFAIEIKEKGTFEWCRDFIPSGAKVVGYFNDIAKAANFAQQIDSSPGAKGIYVGLNPSKSELLGRANNRIVTCKNRTKVDEILKCSNFLIDIDPVRASGTSSTDEAHNAAINLAKTVEVYLTSIGWPQPLICDSGNGAHLVYKVDLPNNQEASDKLSNVLRILAKKFDTENLKIDNSVSGPNGLTKLYGTHARKGDPTPTQPHRQSTIIKIPTSKITVTDDQIKKLLPEKTISNDQNSLNTENNQYTQNELITNFDVKSYLKHYNIKTSEVKKHGDATQYLLDKCVFDPAHTPKKAGITVTGNGKLTYRCKHDSCKNYLWKDARRKISGQDSLEQFVKALVCPPIIGPCLMRVAERPIRFEGGFEHG
jgi:hypothetical protein